MSKSKIQIKISAKMPTSSELRKWFHRVMALAVSRYFAILMDAKQYNTNYWN